MMRAVQYVFSLEISWRKEKVQSKIVRFFFELAFASFLKRNF